MPPNDVERCGHKKTVTCFALNAEKGMVASGSYDRKTNLWDMASGKPLHAKGLAGSGRAVRSVAFSPDGGLIASGCGDGVIVIRDTSNGNLIHKGLKGHGSAVWCLCFSPDGSLLASGSEDKTVMIWDCIGGRATTGPLKGHKNWVISICFSANGNFIASGSYDRTVRMWTATGACIGEPLRAAYIVRGVKFARQDTRLHATVEASEDHRWLLDSEAKAEEFPESEWECTNTGKGDDQLVVKKESLEILDHHGKNVLAHFDCRASCETVHDNERQRLWVGLCDGIVAVVELSE